MHVNDAGAGGDETQPKIRKVVVHLLDSLEVFYSAVLRPLRLAIPQCTEGKGIIFQETV